MYMYNATEYSASARFLTRRERKGGVKIWIIVFQICKFTSNERGKPLMFGRLTSKNTFTFQFVLVEQGENATR